MYIRTKCFALRIFSVFMVLLWICMCIGFGVRAAETEKRLVRIPCEINDMLRLDKNGVPTGQCAEYIKKLGEINGWEYEYVKCSWPKAVEKLENGELDILFPVVYNQELEKSMDFSTMVGGYTASGLFALPHNYYYDDFASFNGARIGIEKEGTNEKSLINYAKENSFSYTPVYLDTADEKFKALFDGKVDMIISDASNEVNEASLVAVLADEPFYYSVKKGNDSLLRELNWGMQQLLLYSHDTVTKTMQNTLIGSNTEIVALTGEERAFIDSKKEITIGFYNNSEPLSSLDKNGELSGIYVEFMDYVKEKSGLNLKKAVIDCDRNWKDLIRSGEIDFYVGGSDTIIPNDNDICVSDSFLEYYSVLVTKSNCAFNELQEPVLALTHNRSGWSKHLKSIINKKIKIKYYDTARECVLAVVNGTADGTFLNNMEFNYQSKNSRFAELIQWSNYRFETKTNLIASANVDKVMLSAVNKSLRVLSDEYINIVVNEYLNMPYKSFTLADKLYSARFVVTAIGTVVTAIIIICIIVLLMRKRQNAIREMIRKQERHQLQILAALSYDYSVIYHIDLDNNLSEAISRDKTRCETLNVQQSSPIRKYSEAFKKYVDKYVLEKYHSELMPLSDPCEVAQRLKREKQFTLRYQIHQDVRNQTFFEMNFVDVSDDSRVSSTAVMGIRCVDNVVEDEQKQRQVLQAALDSAKRANNAKSEFLSKMSHDIRTPLNAIIGMTAIAETHADKPERVRDAMHKISSAGKHLLGLINDILDMSKIESGSMQLNEEPFNISDLLNTMLTIVQPQIKEHNHSVKINTQGIQHPNVIGDSMRIQQAFVNIIGNAIKYTPDGGDISVTVKEKSVNTPSAGCYEFIFKDNGIGISKDCLPYIFKPFERANDLHTAKIQGTGLGLSITQNIAQMMNGNISVESEPGKGSVFTMTIFLKFQDLKIANVSDLAGLPVLVVDDDSDACDSICLLLDEIGMKGFGYNNGKDAIEAVNQSLKDSSPFYAAIIDWKMSGMDGLETATAIRGIAGKELPIIILSAYNWSDIEEEAEALSDVEFLSKPVFKSSLIELFKSLKGSNGKQNTEFGLTNIFKNNYTSRRALLVEDNSLNREIATEILEATGISIEQAEDGKSAVDMFASSANGYYDLIFMDIQMPIMNGYEATKAIRSLKRTDAAEIPIIAMTANAFVDDIQKAKTAGMNEHLSKPIDIEKLKMVLNKYL